ncbi:MAG: 30S ribosomal protein S9 [Elusimicrobiota bacterium]
MVNMNELNAVGRRKTAVARVYMFPEKKEKKILVNGKPIKTYFQGHDLQYKDAISPFEALNIEPSSLIKINVKGGGVSGQAGAIKLGISRVFAQLDEKSRKILRSKGFLTRDSRVVERKKPGHRKARKSEQFSKR